ncbi:tyrosine-type recombinase/integrase [Psychromonas sp. PT13]|uniref:tyrosine-type recombinase/integrase n=1 Tax=Psychromonas sp. PT13 TaxID=3439547 RepID=UPI003EB9C904
MSKTVAVKISDALIKRYAKDPSVGTLRDTRHPELRFRFKSGERGSWFLVLHQQGKSSWKKLGNYPAVKAGSVLKFFPDVLAEHTLTSRAKMVLPEWELVADLLAWYENRVLSNRFLSLKRKRSIKSVIKVHLQPRLGEVMIEDLDHALLDERLVWPLQEKYELSTVRLILSVLKKACKQARMLSLIAFNPIAEIKFSDFTDAQIQPKDCALKANAVTLLSEQLRRADEMERTFVLMILLHGSRIGETRLAQWKHIDFVKKVWFIPAENTKTKTAHTLPLSDVALNVLTEFKNNDAQGFIFKLSAQAGISETTANDIIQHVSERKWCAHDLRKFARTTWMDLDIDYLVGEMLLNHVLNKMDKTYIHTHADNLMRRALVKYHHWLTEQGLIPQHEPVVGWV